MRAGGSLGGAAAQIGVSPSVLSRYIGRADSRRELMEAAKLEKRLGALAAMQEGAGAVVDTYLARMLERVTRGKGLTSSEIGLLKDIMATEHPELKAKQVQTAVQINQYASDPVGRLLSEERALEAEVVDDAG